MNAILPTYKKSGIPVTGGGTGGDEFANPPIKNIFIVNLIIQLRQKSF